MKVRWTTQAEQDRAEIMSYPRAAVAMDDRFSSAAARLASFPGLGTSGKVAGPAS